MIKYQLIRSKRRKTLMLQVKQGQVVVRAPYHVDTGFIDNFIHEKSAWLVKKLAEQQAKPSFCDFSNNANILFLGELLTLNIGVARHASIFVDSGLISHGLTNHSLANDELTEDIELSSIYQPVPRQLNVIISNRANNRLTEPLAQAQYVKKQLEHYFKQQAEQLISERLALISKQTSLVPSKVTIRQYRARWGSCNNRGEVSFNYLLMMTPCYVIDYVIVHELCHLVHLNHSTAFWQLVAKYSANYQVAKEWLNKHQTQLYWQSPR
ncbi:M48 family metallopeptidase [Colwellia ponticola]|uniref:M48 family metallopeptidase n=1 Tax=Colwellia ponticola TaxID=2304625 RepID=A0A8H2PNA0_9GAMM|nr:SprT family zinc-dependent metalloprotease [Colwellia ponticola]TMM47581.1 M48 family metallopeptidase [Colwellia ponticola]